MFQDYIISYRHIANKNIDIRIGIASDSGIFIVSYNNKIYFSFYENQGELIDIEKIIQEKINCLDMVQIKLNQKQEEKSCFAILQDFRLLIIHLQCHNRNMKLIKKNQYILRQFDNQNKDLILLSIMRQSQNKSLNNQIFVKSYNYNKKQLNLFNIEIQQQKFIKYNKIQFYQGVNHVKNKLKQLDVDTIQTKYINSHILIYNLDASNNNNYYHQIFVFYKKYNEQQNNTLSSIFSQTFSHVEGLLADIFVQKNSKKQFLSSDVVLFYQKDGLLEMIYTKMNEIRVILKKFTFNLTLNGIIKSSFKNQQHTQSFLIISRKQLQKQSICLLPSPISNIQIKNKINQQNININIQYYMIHDNHIFLFSKKQIGIIRPITKRNIYNRFINQINIKYKQIDKIKSEILNLLN